MRLTIGNRLALGFGILTFLTILIFLLTFVTVNRSRQISNEITENYSPSVIVLEKLNVLVVRSKLLILNWFHIQNTDDVDKKRLRALFDYEYPILKGEVRELAEHWDDEQQRQIDTVFRHIDSLFSYHREVMELLSTFDSYKDATAFFLSSNLLDSEIGDLTTDALARIEQMIARHQTFTTERSASMIRSFRVLQWIVICSGILLVAGGLLIAIFTTRSIVRPVKKLKSILISMGRGVLPREILKKRNDEIGDMIHAMNGLIDGLSRTINFSSQIGMGNFRVDHKPLSEDDTLGHTLLKMRDELKESERILEEKVQLRTEEVVEKSHEIERQKEELQILFNQVTDSIRYAKRIQEAILPPPELVAEMLPSHFIYYRPKDIVSGDFYWIEKKKDTVVFAAVDCTGHGVPGAFMSIVGHNLLKQILDRSDTIRPAAILDELSIGITNTLRQTSDEHGAKDGMDIALCSLNKKSLTLCYAGAYNPLYVIRNGEISITDANRFPVGIFYGREVKKFTQHDIRLRKGDRVYIFSDGCIDQFGGRDGKKLLSRRFRKILLDLQNLGMKEQEKMLDKKINEWRGDAEQVDDILVIGVEI